MSKIIRLKKRHKNKEDKDRLSETHPDNQKYWNRVLDGLEKLYLETINKNGR